MNNTLESNNGVFPVKILSSYATKITGKFRKYVKIYVKFAYPLEMFKDKFQKVTGEAFLEVPSFDFQAGYLLPGKIILLKLVKDSVVVYLGPEGDWETMYNLKGTNPDQKVKARDMGYTFANFSESTNHGVIENKLHDWLEVWLDGVSYVVASKGRRMENDQPVFYIKPGLCSGDELKVQYGISLLREYCKNKGYKLVESSSPYTND